MGKSIDEVSTDPEGTIDDYMNEYLRKDIEEVEKRIEDLLNKEFKIVIDKEFAKKLLEKKGIK